MKTTAYEAINEEARVFVAYGGSPAKCLKNMANLLDEKGIDFWVSSRVDYRDDGPYKQRFSLIVYV